jgi:hypothetical protein
MAEIDAQAEMRRDEIARARAGRALGRHPYARIGRERVVEPLPAETRHERDAIREEEQLVLGREGEPRPRERRRRAGVDRAAADLVGVLEALDARRGEHARDLVRTDRAARHDLAADGGRRIGHVRLVERAVRVGREVLVLIEPEDVAVEPDGPRPGRLGRERHVHELALRITVAGLRLQRLAPRDASRTNRS